MLGGVVREVRTIGEDDWATWREVRLRALRDSPRAFASTYSRELGFSEELWRSRLGDPAAVSALAVEDGVPIGIGGGFQDRPGFVQVVAMWVQPSARGRGVGPEILDAVRQWADERRLRLHLDVSTANPGARRSYERYGFVGTGETRPLREGATDLVERMVLDRR